MSEQTIDKKVDSAKKRKINYAVLQEEIFENKINAVPVSAISFGSMSFIQLSSK